MTPSSSNAGTHRLASLAGIVALVFSIVAVAALNAHSAQVWDKPTRGVFGVKAGLITGTETRGDVQVRTGWDKSLQVFADIPVTRPVALQFAFDFHSMRSNRLDNWMIDVNVAIKPTFRLEEKRVDIKPGVAVGFGSIGEFESYFEDTDYITVKTFVEASFEIDRKWAWLAEFSVLFTPRGGKGDYDIRLGPVFLLRFGIAMR